MVFDSRPILISKQASGGADTKPRRVLQTLWPAEVVHENVVDVFAATDHRSARHFALVADPA